MSDKNNHKDQEQDEMKDTTANAAAEENQEQVNETAEEETQEQEEIGPAAELAEMKDKYVRLMAEFENFRRRTAKERLELSKTASQDVLGALLPVIDDMERARQSMDSNIDPEVMKQGLDLVFNKLNQVTQQKGLKPMDLKAGDDFDSDTQEAITQIPAPSDELKGKIVDVIEKGYTLNEKVIRFAKVVIGA